MQSLGTRRMDRFASNHCIYSDEAEPYADAYPTRRRLITHNVSDQSPTHRQRPGGAVAGAHPLAVADSSGITPIPVAIASAATWRSRLRMHPRPQRTRRSQRSGAVSIASAATSRSRPSDVSPIVADSSMATLRTSIRRIGGDESERTSDVPATVADSSPATPRPVVIASATTSRSRASAVLCASRPRALATLRTNIHRVTGDERARFSSAPLTVADSSLATRRISIHRVGGDESEPHFGSTSDRRRLISPMLRAWCESGSIPASERRSGARRLRTRASSSGTLLLLAVRRGPPGPIAPREGATCG